MKNSQDPQTTIVLVTIKVAYDLNDGVHQHAKCPSSCHVGLNAPKLRTLTVGAEASEKYTPWDKCGYVRISAPEALRHGVALGRRTRSFGRSQTDTACADNTEDAACQWRSKPLKRALSDIGYLEH